MSDVALFPTETVVEASVADSEARLRASVEEHYDFVWRSVRRLGVPAASTEDAVQKVFIVLSRRIADVRSGAERPFLFATAVRVAADERKAARRALVVPDEDAVSRASDAQDGADVLLDQHRARALLDAALERLPVELRVVFVLANMDEMTMADAAAVLDIPAGTVASRLRRARRLFAEVAREMQAAHGRGPQ